MKTLCLPHVISETAINHNIHDAANKFLEPLVRNNIVFEHERVEDLPLVSAIVDCTVVEIKGPDTPFCTQDAFYSGKHKRHCLKKEVIVNVRSGTAAMISDEYPGSVSDLEVLRRHAEEVNQMLGDTRMLADKGYRGNTRVPNCMVVSPTRKVEKRQRLMVERFFGRLKSTFMVFATCWEFSGNCFSAFFNIACALTNLSIMVSPLNHDDWDFNKKLLKSGSVLLLSESKKKGKRENGRKPTELKKDARRL